MIQGTASDVGKSLLTAALCRIFARTGLAVAPFKSQNMSLNSYVTLDGKEIGRAQGMQADACGIQATTDMNPILLKPASDMASQVVVHGKPLAVMDAQAYRRDYLKQAEPIVREALERLRVAHDLVLIEGAGSPAEVNLKDNDIVNMRLAGWADAPVLLVADIDRGGVFASIVGTLDILEPHERERVNGFIINKFRGDVALLQPGLDWLEARTGKPVVGVIPFLPNLSLEDEDSLSLRSSKFAANHSEEGATSARLDIAVIRLPRLSNFTDADPLLAETDVTVRYVEQAEQFGKPDAVLLPGSKNTISDLAFLRTTGLDRKITTYVEGGGWLGGICGGYQMLGETLLDPHGVDSVPGLQQAEGLGLISAETVFATVKKTLRVQGSATGWNEREEQDQAHQAHQAHQDIQRKQLRPGAIPVEGYEIHMGVTKLGEGQMPFIRLEDGTFDGVRSPDGRLWGTYLHGILHNDELRRSWLNAIRTSKGWTTYEGVPLRFGELRASEFDRLADHVEQHLNMDYVYDIIGFSHEIDISHKIEIGQKEIDIK
ncbi:cobalamin biosynthesis protein CobQ [Paenibacillus swuensis]|uniref:Cobyric acid synthase n=2 Tax=Paenibacillus swuensis TaxID=1178515 RepID=A0A172TNZ5_9BACL|nr:cobalamin biosynthesis protein CobQ [Paenibacillus swuensis]